MPILRRVPTPHKLYVGAQLATKYVTFGIFLHKVLCNGYKPACLKCRHNILLLRELKKAKFSKSSIMMTSVNHMLNAHVDTARSFPLAVADKQLSNTVINLI